MSESFPNITPAVNGSKRFARDFSFAQGGEGRHSGVYSDRRQHGVEGKDSQGLASICCRSNGGLFITFEGPDGAGKTSQVEMLSSYLIRKGYKTLTTKEPGSDEVGARIRELILFSGLKISSKAEALLYAADRAQHVEKVILPALQRGEIVICDRFIDSSIAYQGAGRGIGEEAVIAANSLISLMPDLTFILGLSPEKAFLRKGGADKNDSIESEDIAFHQRVYNKFIELAARFPKRITLIDATLPMEEIGEMIIEKVTKLVSI